MDIPSSIQYQAWRTRPHTKLNVANNSTIPTRSRPWRRYQGADVGTGCEPVSGRCRCSPPLAPGVGGWWRSGLVVVTVDVAAPTDPVSSIT